MKEIFFWAIDSTPILDQGPFFLLSSRHAGCRYCHALRGSWKRVFRKRNKDKDTDSLEEKRHSSIYACQKVFKRQGSFGTKAQSALWLDFTSRSFLYSMGYSIKKKEQPQMQMKRWPKILYYLFPFSPDLASLKLTKRFLHFQ